jgi:hypothetical protein
MDDSLVMGILHRLGDLYNRGQDSLWRDLLPWWKTVAQRAKGRILHHKKEGASFHPKFNDAHNIGMLETSNGLCLAAEAHHFLLVQVRVKHFKRHLGAQITMLAQVDLSKRAFSKQAQKLVVAKVLIAAVSHDIPPP